MQGWVLPYNVSPLVKVEGQECPEVVLGGSGGNTPSLFAVVLEIGMDDKNIGTPSSPESRMLLPDFTAILSTHPILSSIQ